MVQKQESGSREAKPRTSNCLSPQLPEGCDCNCDVCEAATHQRGGSDRRPLEAVAATAAVKSNSKALLDLEDKSTASSLESKLSFCNGDESFLSRSTKLNPPDKKPAISSIPQSQFQGKVKDFLGVISEANNNLELDAKTNPGKNHDIEALTREESEYIEMDLMLGVAELQTEEAVAAAESALAGLSPPLGFYILDTLICSHRTSGLTRSSTTVARSSPSSSSINIYPSLNHP
nr:glutamic acid-rich protein [Ipomoea batatas]